MPPSDRLASPWKRAAARLIDGVIAIGIVVFIGLLDIFHPDLEFFLAFAVPILYELGFIALSGDTPGKRVMGIEVIRADGKAPPGWLTSSIRVGLPALSLIIPLGPLFIYLWLLFDPARQGVHDKVARTYVVDA